MVGRSQLCTKEGNPTRSPISWIFIKKTNWFHDSSSLCDIWSFRLNIQLVCVVGCNLFLTILACELITQLVLLRGLKTVILPRHRESKKSFNNYISHILTAVTRFSKSHSKYQLVINTPFWSSHKPLTRSRSDWTIIRKITPITSVDYTTFV